MFDVLVFVYENYWRPEACPQPQQLSRKLSAVGFEAEEIDEALHWLAGLNHSAGAEAVLPSQPGSLRAWSAAERERLGEEGVAYLSFLESAGVLNSAMREAAVDRALATTLQRLSLEDLKIVLLMVFWSQGIEPDDLVLDELFAPPDARAIH